jgi:hypothetical protein
MRVVSLVLSTLLFFPGFPQQVGTLTPTPVNLQSSLAALSANVTLTDVTLSGSVRRIAGSDDESGTAMLKALSSGAARTDLSLSSGTLSEIYNSSTSGPVGSWSGPDGKLHTIPFHNLLSEPAWFFPTFAISRRVSADYVVTDLGQETRNGRQVEHLSVSQNPPAQFPAGALSFQHLTQLDFYLDSQTFLPAAIAYNIHPDDNALLDIPVEIDFSDFRSVSGVQVPFHIQKFLNNSLLLDLQVQNAAFNSGLSASAFAIE